MNRLQTVVWTAAQRSEFLQEIETKLLANPDLLKHSDVQYALHIGMSRALWTLSDAIDSAILVDTAKQAEAVPA